MFSVDYIKEGPTDLKLASNFFLLVITRLIVIKIELLTELFYDYPLASLYLRAVNR